MTALLYAGAIIVTDRMSHSGSDPLAMGIAQVCTIAVCAAAAAFIFEDPAMPVRARDWGIILGLAVVCTCFGFTLQPVAQRGTTAERAGMFCALSPLSAGLLGVIFLDESLGLQGVAGAALILCGIALPNLLAAVKSRAGGGRCLSPAQTSRHGGGKTKGTPGLSGVPPVSGAGVSRPRSRMPAAGPGNRR